MIQYHQYGVHNIFASLRARFLAPLGCWLWISSEHCASDS
jgi:hypothetical protein